MAFNKGNFNKGNRNNNNKKKNDYFNQNIQKNGDDFLRMKNSKDIEFESSKIFRDLARGNVNIEQHGHFFLETQFRNSLQSAMHKKAMYYYNIHIAMDFYLTSPSTQNVDQNMLETYEMIKSKYNAYNIINNGLNKISMTGNINELYILVRDLQSFKYVLD